MGRVVPLPMVSVNGDPAGTRKSVHGEHPEVVLRTGQSSPVTV